MALKRTLPFDVETYCTTMTLCPNNPNRGFCKIQGGQKNRLSVFRLENIMFIVVSYYYGSKNARAWWGGVGAL